MLYKGAATELIRNALTTHRIPEIERCKGNHLGVHECRLVDSIAGVVGQAKISPFELAWLRRALVGFMRQKI